MVGPFVMEGQLMPDNNPATSAQPSASRPAGQTQSKEQPRQGNSGQNSEPGEGLADALQTQHKARTEVPGHPGIDARLDNRAGAFRPPLETFPAKPQQIDGPDVAGQAAHTAATLKNLESEVGERKGAFSAGPHGLSDESLRESGTVFGAEGLSADDAAKGPKAV